MIFELKVIPLSSKTPYFCKFVAFLLLETFGWGLKGLALAWLAGLKI